MNETLISCEGRWEQVRPDLMETDESISIGQNDISSYDILQWMMEFGSEFVSMHNPPHKYLESIHAIDRDVEFGFNENKFLVPMGTGEKFQFPVGLLAFTDKRIRVIHKIKKYKRDYIVSYLFKKLNGAIHFKINDMMWIEKMKEFLKGPGAAVCTDSPPELERNYIATFGEKCIAHFGISTGKVDTREITNTVPPIFREPLSVPPELENVEEWCFKNQKALMKDCLNTNIDTKKFLGPQKKHIIDCPDGISGCLVLHQRTEYLLDDESIELRKRINSKTIGYDELSRMWKKFIEENIMKLVESKIYKYISQHLDEDDFVEFPNIFSDCYYIVRGGWRHYDQKDLGQWKWRNYILGSGMIR